MLQDYALSQSTASELHGDAVLGEGMREIAVAPATLV
jgi:hypothetical protein